jgi:hypothetical protein
MMSGPLDGIVVSPDGRQWHVRRVCFFGADPPPPPQEDLDVLPTPIEGVLDALFSWRVAAIAACLLAFSGALAVLLGAPAVYVIVVAVGLLLLFPTVMGLVDMLALGALPVFVALLALLGLYYLAKIALRRPWTIEAVELGTPRTTLRWAVRGWSLSGAAVEEIKSALWRGDDHFVPRGATGPPRTLT